jgi:hypothetical protein
LGTARIVEAEARGALPVPPEQAASAVAAMPRVTFRLVIRILPPAR